MPDTYPRDEIIMIRTCKPADFEAIYAIINDAAQAYKGIIPPDRWHEPYMTPAALTREMEAGVVFWGFAQEDDLVGVMGIQDRGEVHLIRHAYVATSARRQGIGTRLLHHLDSEVAQPLLVGTWAAARWAIAFYQKNGYRLVPEAEKNRLLRRYWHISERQIETSVVLANKQWLDAQVDTLGES